MANVGELEFQSTTVRTGCHLPDIFKKDKDSIKRFEMYFILLKYKG